MTAKKRKVAIFDIDGTIFRSSLLIEVVDEMIAEGLVPSAISREYLAQRAKWLNREGTYDDYIDAVVRAFLRHIKGVPWRRFTVASRRVVDRNGKHVYRYTRELIARLKRRGYFLLAISNSPKDILDEFCRQLGFDLVYGRIYEKDRSGRLTPEIRYHDLIVDKAKILKRAMIKHGLTLKGSFGVGDSEADIPFLKMVERPICFNPNSKLLAVARRRGWRIGVERKDVVYDIK
jgi:HAD superfamily hydrolase (TIGR01490 family)